MQIVQAFFGMLRIVLISFVQIAQASLRTLRGAGQQRSDTLKKWIRSKYSLSDVEPRSIEDMHRAGDWLERACSVPAHGMPILFEEETPPEMPNSGPSPKVAIRQSRVFRAYSTVS